MKHTIDEHLANIRKNVPGLRASDILKRLTGEAIERNCSQSERGGGKLQPLGIDCAVIMEQEDKAARDVIAIIAAMIDFEAVDTPAPTVSQAMSQDKKGKKK